MILHYLSCKRNADTREEFLARILDATVRIKGSQYQIRRRTRDLCTRFAKRVEDVGGSFENLLRTVTNLSFMRNKFFI